MGAGAICLGLDLRQAGAPIPGDRRTLRVYPLAYGDFPGFLIAWGYWISIWASLPVIAVALAGAIVDFSPCWADG